MGKCLIIKGADFSSVSAEQVTIEDPRVVITVLASPVGGGTVTGTGSYNPGQTVTITATAAEGYAFKQWNDGNTNASRTITVGNSAETYTAEFEEKIELVTTVNGGYLNQSGVVTGEGNASFSTYTVHFYKVAVNSVHITCANSGVAGVNATSVYAQYSGLDENGRGTGLITRGSAATDGASVDEVIDTTTYKYIGTCERLTGSHTPVEIEEYIAP